MLSCFVTDDELDPKCRVQVVAAPTIFLHSRWEPTPPLTFDQISIGGFAAALRCNAANFSSPRGASSQVNWGSRMRRLIKLRSCFVCSTFQFGLKTVSRLCT